MADTNRDSCPEMLLSKRFWEFSAVVVVSADEAGEPHATSSYVVDGTASGGGSRSWVLGSAAGDGLYEFEGQSMSTDWPLKHYRAAGDKIQLVGTRPVSPTTPPEAVMLDWSSTTDPSLMLAAVQGAPMPSTPQESTVAADTPVEAPRHLGPNEVRITGTVRFVTAYDLVNEPLSSLNGRYPNPGYDKPDDPYVILVLDQPITLEGGRPGFSELESRNVKFVSLAAKGQDRNTWIPFDGQHVELIYDKQASNWASDTGLPLGILRASVTEVNVK